MLSSNLQSQASDIWGKNWQNNAPSNIPASQCRKKCLVDSVSILHVQKRSMRSWKFYLNLCSLEFGFNPNGLWISYIGLGDGRHSLNPSRDFLYKLSISNQRIEIIPLINGERIKLIFEILSAAVNDF